MVELNCDLISLNTAGLRDYEKRRKVFHYLKQQVSKSAIIFMQETHTVKSDEKIPQISSSERESWQIINIWEINLIPMRIPPIFST